MVVEVRLLLTQKSAALSIVRGGKQVVEEEQWKFDSPAPNRELLDLAECVFHDCYDLLNHAAHGAN
jgi:hypothetical protein